MPSLRTSEIFVYGGYFVFAMFTMGQADQKPTHRCLWVFETFLLISNNCNRITSNFGVVRWD